MKRRIFCSVILGVAITALTMLLSHEHCMDGPGRGLPFAVYSPICGAWFLILELDDSKIPQVIDFGALIVDVLFWASLVALAMFFKNRKDNNKAKKQIERPITYPHEAK